MSLKFSKNENKNFFINLIIINLFFLVPLYLFGINHYEEGYYHYFSLEVLYQNNFNPFIFFYDLLGPGSKFPVGHGFFYFFPSSFFINNKLIFFFLTVLIGITLQAFYLNRVLKIFKFDTASFLFPLLYCLSITNICFIFDFDYLDHFLSFSLLPAILFYSINFFKEKNKTDFYIIILIISYLTLNGHLPYSFIIYLFITLFFLLNKNFFLFKKSFFYFALLIALFILFEFLFFMTSELLTHWTINRSSGWSYQFKHFWSGFYYFLQFFNDHIINLNFISANYTSNSTVFMPFSGLLIYFSFIESVVLTIKKESKKYYYINFIFLIFYFLSSLTITKTLKILSGPYYLRDICVFLSIFLFISFLQRINGKYLKNIICYFVLIFSLVFYLQNIILLKDLSSVNYLKKNIKINEDVLYKKLNQLDLNEFSKTYLSPKIYEHFSDHIKFGDNNLEIFENANIFQSTDLIQYNIFPFNYNFKNSSKNNLVKPDSKMYSFIKSNYKEINDARFTNIFLINNLLILNSELSEIDINNYKVIFEIPFEKDKLIFLEKKNKSKIILKETSISNLEKTICGDFETVYCLLKNNKKDFSFSSEIEITRNSLNNFTIKNLSSNKLSYVLPFLFDKNWRITSNNLNGINETFMYVSIEPGQTLKLYYQDRVRFVLKLISICAFLFLIILIGRKKLLNK